MRNTARMTASLSSGPRRIAALVLALTVIVTIAVGCRRSAGDAAGDAAPVRVTGDFLVDGTCHALVEGAPLFAAGDGQRSGYDPGPVADIAPAGYTLRQLTCAPVGVDPALPPDRADERMVLVTLYARAGAPLRVGRFAIRAGLATTGDAAGAAARAGVAVFGALRPGGASGARRVGVRYLEGREGVLTITSADGGRVVGTFSMRAGAAWSM